MLNQVETVHGISSEVEKYCSPWVNGWCEESGYKRPDLLLKSLSMIRQAFSDNHHTLIDVENSKDTHNPIELLFDEAIGISTIGMVLQSPNVEAINYPGEGSVIDALLCSQSDGGRDRVRTQYDYVNHDAMRHFLRVGHPAHKEGYLAKLFKRAGLRVEDDYKGLSAKQIISKPIPRGEFEYPVVMVENGYLTNQPHVAISLEVQGFGKLIDILVVGEGTDGKDILRYGGRLSYYSGVEHTLALEASRIALEQGMYPFGATLLIPGGEVVVARNDTNKDGEPEKHAEFLALKQNNRPGADLIATTEPCHSCASLAYEKGVRALRYMLKQPKGYAGMGSFRELWRLKNVKAWDLQLKGMIPSALDVIMEATDSDGKFPGEFTEILTLNDGIHTTYKAKQQRLMEKRLGKKS